MTTVAPCAAGESGLSRKPRRRARRRLHMPYPASLARGLILGPALLATSSLAQAGTAEHTLPLFPPAGDVRQGIARIINHSPRSGTVTIHGTDDAGHVHGPVTLHLESHATQHFSSADLEQGNASAGLSGGLGNGEGSWRLRLETDLEIEPSAYLRASGRVARLRARCRPHRRGRGQDDSSRLDLHPRNQRESDELAASDQRLRQQSRSHHSRP